jgi:cyclophilin family peptidyl-prolyl cis-trans isomerase
MRLTAITAGLLLTISLFSTPALSQRKTVKKPVRKATTGVRITPVKTIVPNIPGTRVLISTDSGNMIVRLYDSTPLHRDNFIAKVNEGFYDSLLFHRVINGFMLQGGDPNSKNAQPGEMLGAGSAPGERIPAEFLPSLFHKKGALAAARDQNPERASSNCQFYIVQGKKYTDESLNLLQVQTGRTFTAAEREIYKRDGGTPFLDQNYTVYGEVEAGINVIDKIAAVPTIVPGDRPVGDVRMKMRVLTEEEYKTMEREMKPRKAVKPIVKKVVRKKY